MDDFSEKFGSSRRRSRDHTTVFIYGILAGGLSRKIRIYSRRIKNGLFSRGDYV